MADLWLRKKKGKKRVTFWHGGRKTEYYEPKKSIVKKPLCEKHNEELIYCVACLRETGEECLKAGAISEIEKLIDYLGIGSVKKKDYWMIPTADKQLLSYLETRLKDLDSVEVITGSTNDLRKVVGLEPKKKLEK